MKKTVRTIAIYIFAAVLAVFCFFTVSAQSFLTARAETRAAELTGFDGTNVLDDLEGSTIAGKEFSLADYAPNAYTKTDAILLAEYCYGYYENMRGDYGLYVYVWNPQLIGYDLRSELNQIELATAENDHYYKYPLEFLNMSEEPGYEGVLYKFKVSLSADQKDEIFEDFSGKQERYYHVSGIELLQNGELNATDYNVNKAFVYSGYAEGCGPNAEAESTLTFRQESGKTLELDVHSTYWRPEGTHSDGYTRDTIHSVYFSVPNDDIAEYGEISAVHARWLNAYTTPIFVTGNKEIYNAMLPYIAEFVNGGSRTVDTANTELQYSAVAVKAADEGKTDTELAPYAGFYSFNHYTDTDVPGMLYGTYDNPIYFLNYLLYAENNDADNYDVPAETLLGNKETGTKGYLEWFTEEYKNGEGGFEPGDFDDTIIVGGNVPIPDYTTLINGKYLSALFDKVDEDFTDINISSDTEYKLTDKVVSNSIWDKIFGNTIQSENTYYLSAIQKVEQRDINSYNSVSEFCNDFYVAESDYSNFVEYVKQEESQGNTVYLFRYYQSEYISHEAVEYKKSTSWDLFTGTYYGFDFVDTNAYFAQMWIQLDFDIIDISFTDDELKTTIIAAIMSPQDIAADLEPPAQTIPDKNVPWLTIALLLAVSIGGIVVTRIVKHYAKKS